MKKTSEIETAILKVLSESGKPIGASQVAGMLLAAGVDLQPRTVRYHLLRLDSVGFTKLVSRRMGRVITDHGRERVLEANPAEKLGIVSARVDTLRYRMTFTREFGEGTLITNIAFVDPADFSSVMKEIQLVISQDYTMGQKIVVGEFGDQLGGILVPEGTLGIGVVCSMALNGILQKEGIPVVSRFGGLLEIRERRIVRFVNMIEYRGSTLDPMEVFIKADMTRVRNVLLRGTGIICASFREVPSPAVEHVKAVVKALKKYGMGGILALGKPNQPLFGVAVSEGHCGMIIAGGLNSIAGAVEKGIRITMHSLAGLVDYGDFITVRAAIRKYG